MKCREILIIPPHNFIEYNIIIDENDRYKNEVWVDECVADEIQELWRNGIHTSGCCCGHGTENGFISVFGRDIEKMTNLGYKHATADFIPKGYEKYYFKPKTACRMKGVNQ